MKACIKKSALTGAGLFCLATIGTAQAVTFSYGYSTNTISDFTITPSNGAFALSNRVEGGLSTAAAGHNRGEDTLNDNNVDSGSFTSPLAVGTTESYDSAIATSGSAIPVFTNNDVTAAGRTGSYGRGDSLITVTGSASTFPPTASLLAVSEAYRALSSSPTPSDGSRPSSGNGDAQYSTVFTADTTSGFTISFDASPLIDVELESDGAALLGSQSTGALSFSVSIVEAATGDEVFTWSPNGSEGIFTGGTDVGGDPFSLNLSRSALVDNQIIYDPALGGTGTFIAVSDANLLTAGTDYNLTVALGTGASALIDANVVPAPASLLLLGLGLAGLTRRRAAITA